MTITKKMLLAAGSAKTAYNTYLTEEKEQNEKAQKTQKKALLDELDELKKKKRCTEEGIKTSEQVADECAEAMERKGDLKIIAKFNAMRQSLKTKQQELDTLELNIKEKVDEIATS
jgi:predicted P-loop ATPase/GTPase